MITGSSSGVGDPVRLHPADAAGRPVDEGLAARRIRSTGSISRTKFGMQPLHHGLDDLLGDLGEDGFLGIEVGRIRISAAVTGDGHPAAGSLPLAG